MNTIRPRLVALASMLLVSQLAVLAAVPVFLYETRAVAGGSELLCDCKVEPGAECPMHGGRKHEEPGRRAPRFSPVCGDQAAAILTLLATGSGTFEPSSPIARPATLSAAVTVATDSVLDTPRPPTSPPPRG